MRESSDMAQRHGRMLARLSELAMGLAEQVHADAMAAEDPEVRAQLATAFHRVSRSLRQTLALEARLTREHAAAEAKRRPEDDPRVPARKAEVREALARVVWNEYERQEAEAYLQDAEWYVDLAAEEDHFLTDPIPVIVARLCRQLEIPLRSLEPAKRGCDAPNPTAPPDRQSSA